MEDWNADLLLQVIQYLNLKDAGRFASVCRRCYFLVHENRKLRGPELVSTQSFVGLDDPQLSVDETCQLAISKLQSPPFLSLAFASVSDDSTDRTGESIFGALARHTPSDTVTLAVVATQIQTANGPTSDDCECQSSHALMMLAGFPDMTVHPFWFLSDTLFHNVDFDRYCDDHFEDSLDCKVFIMYACGEGALGVPFLARAIYKKFPLATIVGGICEGAHVSVPIDMNLDQTIRRNETDLEDLLQMYKGMGGRESLNDSTSRDVVIQKVLELSQEKSYMMAHIDENDGGICGVGLAGTVPLKSFVSRGVRSLTSVLRQKGAADTPETDSSSFQIAKVGFYKPGDQGHDNEIAWRQSYHTIEKIRETATGKLYTVDQMINRFGSADYFGICRRHEDGFTLEAVNQNEVFVKMAESDSRESIVGCDFDLFELCEVACGEDLEYCMTRLREQTAGGNILGALMFTCNARGPDSGSMLPSDIGCFANIFPTVPCLGFYAAGEIGPVARAGRKNIFQHGRACIHEFTAIFTVFAVPKLDLGATTRMLLDDNPTSIDNFVRERFHSGEQQQKKKLRRSYRGITAYLAVKENHQTD